MKALKYILIVIVALALIMGIGICLYISFVKDLSPNESLMIAILVTFFSMFISWILTHVYSQISLRFHTKIAKQQHEENIRTYAIKAAEKVFNLSNELKKLAENLKTGLEEQDGGNDLEICNLVLKERFISTVHCIETLKSMNDTFLSDWRGVIGEEIEKQEALEGQIENLEKERRLIEDLYSQVVSVEDLSSVEKYIRATEKRLESKIKALPFKIQQSSPKTKKHDITVACPECSELNSAKIRAKTGAKKLVLCSNCNRYFAVKEAPSGTLETVNVPMYAFLATCPICSNDFNDELPDFPGTSKRIECERCGFTLLLSKNPDAVNVKVPRDYRHKVSKKVITLVYEKLQNRPWSKFIHKEIAKELVLSHTMVARAINHLINSGKIQKPSIKDELFEQEALDEPADAKGETQEIG